MFSEYASRFLAQSQSRISNFAQPVDNSGTFNGTPNDRYRRLNQPSRNFSRGYSSRLSNPYQNSSHLSHFSRYSTAPEAPLFHSALHEFREEDDEEERERESADFFALQKSRRVFASARLEESSETEPEASSASFNINDIDEGERSFGDPMLIRGIKSSWTGAATGTRRGIGWDPDSISDKKEPQEDDTDGSIRHGDGRKDKMEEIGLGSFNEGDEPPEDFHVELSLDDSPPAFQKFRSISKPETLKQPTANMIGQNFAGAISSPPSAVNTLPTTLSTISEEVPKYDIFWGSLYLICLGGTFATFFLVYLHTETPTKFIGDTIYTTLHASFYLFAVDTLVSIFVSLIWLTLLRSFVRTLVYLIIIAVPVILFSFSLYPFIASFNKTTSSRSSLSDKAMRWLSIIPGVFTFIWIYTVYRGRRSLTKAIGIIEFSLKILSANPGLLVVGFITLASVISWTWVWLVMFTRVFLGGQLSGSLIKFSIDTSTWWLGVYFILMYIWTLSVISGLQRSITAATVSEWYFHRNVQPSSDSKEVIAAATSHATTTLFGTISLSTLIALVVRLPLLLLPHRLTGVISMLAYSWVPTPISTLTNPLTLTYAAIHSQSLQTSARGLCQMSFLTPHDPTTTLTPQSFNATNRQELPVLAYRFAKLILHATRLVMTVALGFGGWVTTAKKLHLTVPQDTGLRGSAYAYVVGLVAGFIGWGVLSTIEGILGGIVDASIICWGSEKSMVGGGAYCLEAGYLFGEGFEHNLP
ncbi:hypothetical protein BGT96224_2394 [Blumeria graminis f. sp. tritici 96224]|uniref:Protein PNS1 n=3 Tax=Blumeria graminis TaxID=34373 RepID=A0A381LGD2_BLUGR|nr:hypothetical protein BGT96224_2394 [Blumeria graminis f. sp. tritici 96224]